MNRRIFLATGGAALASSVISTSAQAEDAFALQLPPLSYEPGALEPHIDALTMTIHHDKHHAAYITSLGKALDAAKVEKKDALALCKDIASLPPEAQTAVRNNAGGHVNHTLFWQFLTPPAESGKPDDKLGAAIQSAFGSMDDFKKKFGEAATKRFGSGWAWLIVDSSGKLAVTSTPNQDNPFMKGIVADKDLGTPILGLDVWEHAYYLKYQNKRPDYITAWWNVVNWKEAGKRFAAAAKA